MADLQNMMDEQFEKIPRLIAQELIRKKLHEVNIEPEMALVDAIVDHILSGKSDAFQWDDGSDIHQNITLSISKEDLEKIDAMSSRFLAAIPTIIEDVSARTAKIYLRTLTNKWTKEHSAQVKEYQNFKKRLERRWGKALGLLRMLLTISREFASEITKTSPPHESNLRNVLTRLHARACQVTAEIIVLLENGYADGAMARWRTLHEISIVMILISEHGEELAKRYIAHGAVEAKSGKDQYLQCYEQLGQQPLSQNECDAIDKKYNHVITAYGKEFRSPYGWAAGYVTKGPRGIGLGELEAAAGRTAMASFYKLASYNIHAGPHALFFRLGTVFSDDSSLLAGATNAGLTEPGKNTAISFTLISLLLGGSKTTLDDLVTMKLLQLIRDKIPNAFFKAEQKLRTDHIHHTRKLKSQKPLH